MSMKRQPILELFEEKQVMKNINYFIIGLLLVVFLAGCAVYPERNYVGMTKQEVAAQLEKEFSFLGREGI